MAAPRPLAPLLIAAAGAVVILADLLGTAGALAGMGAIVVGTALAAPDRSRPGPAGASWWALLAAGAALVAIGVPLALVAETPGGLAAAAGAALVVVAAALGIP